MLEKVLSLLPLSVKDIYNTTKFNELNNSDNAVVSDKTDSVIITTFEGKNIVLVKPSNLEEQLKANKINIAFYSKFLMKKLNTENTFIDTNPIDYRPKRTFNRNDDRRDSFRSNDNFRSNTRSAPVIDYSEDSYFNTNNKRQSQKPRLFQSKNRQDI